MKPKIWGKHFWYTIHLAALGYPANPTFEEKMAYKDFYTSIGKVLPCKKCTLNFARHMADMNLDAHLHSKEQLFNWTVYFHNTVNKEIGKPQWNTEYAMSFYKSFCEQNGKDFDINQIDNSSSLLSFKFLIFINVLFICLVTFFIFRNGRKGI